MALLDAKHLRYRHYNIGSGGTQTVGDFIAWATERVPCLKAELAPTETANIVMNAALKTGMWGEYDLARIERDTDWRPRPARQAFHDYMHWIATNESP